MKKSLLLLLLVTFASQAQNFWTEVAPFPSSPAYYPRQISIVDDNVLWTYGSNGTSPDFNKWSRSVDGGITWAEGDISLPSIELGVGSIYAVSETTAYISVFPSSPAFSGGVWITQDAGITWTQQTAFGTNSFPNFVYFWDGISGISVGDPQNGSFEIYTTADSGLNWAQLSSANIPASLDGEYGYTGQFEARGNSFWFGTNMGRIFKSTDQGINWTVSQSPVSDFGSSNDSGNYAFRNEAEGLLVSQDHKQYRTLDGGDSWTEEISAGVIRNFDVVFVPQTNNAYFIWGEDSENEIRGSSYSTNGGTNWNDLNDADVQPVEPIEVEFQSGLVGFCIGRYLLGGSSETKFFRLTDPLNRLLSKDEFEIGAAFSAYPNPTNGLVNISGANIDSIKIHDISGKEVFNDEYNSLMDVSVDISGFQSGIYLAKIKSHSGGSSIAKIVKQ